MKIALVIVFLIITLVAGFYMGKLAQGLSKPVYSFTDIGLDLEVYGSFTVKDEYGIVLEGKNDPTGVSGHTVDLNCDKSSMTCTETQAFIGPYTNSIVIGNPKTYSIDQWTSNSITSLPQTIDQCTKETLEIDRFSKTVTVRNELSNSDGQCSSLPKGADIITIQ